MPATAVVSQLPDQCLVDMVAGDDFSFTVDFDSGMTGYTFTAARGAQAVTVDPTDLASGVLTVSVTDVQSAAWERGKVGWWLAGTVGGVTRTFLEGTWTLRGRA